MNADKSLSLIVDRLDIIELTARYAYLMDARDVDSVMELWSDDEPVFDESAFGLKKCTGKETIRDYFKVDILGKMEALCHLTTNHIIEEITETSATGTCTVLVEGDVADGGGPARATGSYADRYVREDGVWKFSSRKVSPLTQTQFGAYK